jgi:hypothetical protein
MSTVAEIRAEALTRAVTGQSLANYPAIFSGFAEKGIPESDIDPRGNIFTYRAWQALGRQVRRGEHGVRIATVRHLPEKRNERGEIEKPSRSMPWSATVFHVSQTDSIGGGE